MIELPIESHTINNQNLMQIISHRAYLRDGPGLIWRNFTRCQIKKMYSTNFERYEVYKLWFIKDMCYNSNGTLNYCLSTTYEIYRATEKKFLFKFFINIQH